MTHITKRNYKIPAATYPHDRFKPNLPGQIPSEASFQTVSHYCVRCFEQWEVMDTASRETRNSSCTNMEHNNGLLETNIKLGRAFLAIIWSINFYTVTGI